MLLSAASSSRPPPKYEHPPPYAAHYTPGRGDRGPAGVSEVTIHDAAVHRRELLTAARSTTVGSSSYLSHVILACVVFWLCGCLFGAVAFILASQCHYTYSHWAAPLALRLDAGCSG